MWFPSDIGGFLPINRGRNCMSIVQGIRDYGPTKTTLAWVAGGASVLTMVLGFTVGGWVTGGAADRMALEARTGGQAELAAAVCAANFRESPTARQAHAELTALSATRQRQFVLDQPWAQVPGAQAVSRAAAELCARTITQMDPAELGEPAST
jgi:hypothetical protein